MNEDSARIKILCVDDHPIVRQGIAGLLTAEPDMALVAEAANGREAIQQFRAHRRGRILDEKSRISASHGMRMMVS